MRIMRPYGDDVTAMQKSGLKARPSAQSLLKVPWCRLYVHGATVAVPLHLLRASQYVLRPMIMLQENQLYRPARASHYLLQWNIRLFLTERMFHLTAHKLDSQQAEAQSYLH